MCSVALLLAMIALVVSICANELMIGSRVCVHHSHEDTHCHERVCLAQSSSHEGSIGAAPDDDIYEEMFTELEYCVICCTWVAGGPGDVMIHVIVMIWMASLNNAAKLHMITLSLLLHQPLDGHARRYTCEQFRCCQREVVSMLVIPQYQVVAFLLTLKAGVSEGSITARDTRGRAEDDLRTLRVQYQLDCARGRENVGNIPLLTGGYWGRGPHLGFAKRFLLVGKGTLEEHVHKEKREVGLHGIQLSAGSRGSPPRAGFASFLSRRGTLLADTCTFLALSLADTTALFSVISAIVIIRREVCHCSWRFASLPSALVLARQVGSETLGQGSHQSLQAVSNTSRSHKRVHLLVSERQQSASFSLLRLTDKPGLPN